MSSVKHCWDRQWYGYTGSFLLICPSKEAPLPASRIDRPTGKLQKILSQGNQITCPLARPSHDTGPSTSVWCGQAGKIRNTSTALVTGNLTLHSGFIRWEPPWGKWKYIVFHWRFEINPTSPWLWKVFLFLFKFCHNNPQAVNNGRIFQKNNLPCSSSILPLILRQPGFSAVVRL